MKFSIQVCTLCLASMASANTIGLFKREDYASAIKGSVSATCYEDFAPYSDCLNTISDTTKPDYEEECKVVNDRRCLEPVDSPHTYLPNCSDQEVESIYKYYNAINAVNQFNCVLDEDGKLCELTKELNGAPTNSPSLDHVMFASCRNSCRSGIIDAVIRLRKLTREDTILSDYFDENAIQKFESYQLTLTTQNCRMCEKYTTWEEMKSDEPFISLKPMKTSTDNKANGKTNSKTNSNANANSTSDANISKTVHGLFLTLALVLFYLF